MYKSPHIFLSYIQVYNKSALFHSWITGYLVTDNSTVFTSVEFEIFLSRNVICHITSALYHAATNGLAERAVQTLKRANKKADPTVPILPLYELPQKNHKWSWGKREEAAFQGSKRLLTSSSLLTHYDAAKRLLLSYDASPY